MENNNKTVGENKNENTRNESNEKIKNRNEENLEAEKAEDNLETEGQVQEIHANNWWRGLRYNANLFVAGATFALAIATFVTVRVMKNANVLSKKTLHLMSQDFEMSYRPYVGVGEIQAERKTEKKLMLILHLVNVGRTPANELSIQILPEGKELLVGSPKGKKIDPSKTRIIMPPFPTSLFPQQRFTNRIEIGHNKMSEIYSGEKEYILNVDLRYRGLSKIPEDKYYGYFIKLRYKHSNNTWDILESNAW
ncbi:hypothetical protein ES703_79338 [subsurface metagenome]